MSLLLVLLVQVADATSVSADVHRRFVAEEWEEALKAYARMPEPPPEPAPTDTEALRAARGYREARSIAHWQVSQAYARLGRWEEALSSFRDTRWRRSSWCGNGVADISVDHAVAEGICLERLGRHREALEAYFRVLGSGALTRVDIPAARVVELYSAARDLDGLAERLVREDAAYLKEIAPPRELNLPASPSALEWLPGNQVRPYLQAARAFPGRWTRRRRPDPDRLPFPPVPADFKLR